MEIRARYVLIGAFVLAVIAAGFGFVYWLNNTGGLGERTRYDVRFESSVSGLLPRLRGAVQRHPRRRGDATSGSIPRSRAQVIATIAVRQQHAGPRRHARRPRFRRADRGAGDRALRRRSGVPAASGADGGLALARRAGDRGADWTQAARDAFQRIDTCSAETPMRSKIRSPISTRSSQALGRNSGRIDEIMSGLERFAAMRERAPDGLRSYGAARFRRALPCSRTVSLSLPSRPPSSRSIPRVSWCGPGTARRRL